MKSPPFALILQKKNNNDGSGGDDGGSRNPRDRLAVRAQTAGVCSRERVSMDEGEVTLSSLKDPNPNKRNVSQYLHRHPSYDGNLLRWLTLIDDSGLWHRVNSNRTAEVSGPGIYNMCMCIRIFPQTTQIMWCFSFLFGRWRQRIGEGEEVPWQRGNGMASMATYGKATTNSSSPPLNCPGCLGMYVLR